MISQFCIDALKQCRAVPAPRQRFNPGVSQFLEKSGLVETLMLPSPYIRSAGKNIQHLKITAAGMAALREAAR